MPPAVMLCGALEKPSNPAKELLAYDWWLACCCICLAFKSSFFSILPRSTNLPRSPHLSAAAGAAAMEEVAGAEAKSPKSVSEWALAAAAGMVGR